jgi:transposase
MPAKDVKAYVKRNKNDADDAEAICEAVRRPTMRFVQIKSVEQQARLMLYPALAAASKWGPASSKVRV